MSEDGLERSSTKNSSIKGKWPIILVTFFVVSSFVLIGMPILIEKLFVDWLLENGEDEVRVENVDFNPFMGELVFQGIDVQADGQWTHGYDSASVNVQWLPLFNQHLVVQSVTMRGLQLRIDNSDNRFLNVGGIKIDQLGQSAITPEDSGASWTVTIDSLKFEDVSIEYLDPQLDITLKIDRLELINIDQRHPEQPASIELKGSVQGAPYEVTGRLLAYAKKPSFSGEISLDGFDVSVLKGLVDPSVSDLAGVFSLNSTFTIESGADDLRVQHEGALSLADYMISMPTRVLKGDNLNWTGSGREVVSLESSKLQLDVEGRIDSMALNAANSRPPIEVSYREFEWQGSVALTLMDQELELSSRSNSSVDDLIFLYRAKKLRLGSAGRIEVNGLVVENSEKIAIDLVTIDELVIGAPDQDQSGGSQAAVSNLEKLLVEDFEYSGSLMVIRKIEQKSLVSRMVRDKEGELNAARLTALISEIASSGDGERPVTRNDDALADQAGDKMDVRIGEFVITGQSQLQYIDQFVSPEFSIVFDVLDASILNIDSSKPALPSPIELQAKSGQHTTLDLTGSIKPFLSAPEFALTLNLTAMDLPHLTPYTNTELGLDLLSGTLDSDVKIDLVDNKLMGKIVFKLHQFELDSLDVENSLQSQIPLPLNVALDAIRDRDNMIRLEIPIKGDADDPEFNFDDAIRKALAKGVSKGAMTYLTFALQPYGALLTVAKMAEEEASRVRLKPVDFQEGVSDLDETERDYLAKVASILRERPKVAVKLCGVAVVQDLEVYRQAQLGKAPTSTMPREATEDAAPVSEEERVYLLELARVRASTVKDYLVKTYDSDASHLVSCKPTVSLDKTNERPRTDMLI